MKIKIKTNLKRLLMCILCFFLVVSFSSFTAADEKNTSSVIGYGPIAGDLVKPSSTVEYDGKLYVLDQTGISIFDIETKELIDKHVVNYQKNFLPDFEKIENLHTLYDNLSKGYISCYSPLGKDKDFSIDNHQKYYVQPKMCLDSNQKLYISSQDGIHVLSIDSMIQVGVLSYPSELLEQTENSYIDIITMKIYQDKIFLLKTAYKWVQKANSVIQLDLDGNILKTIEFEWDKFSDSCVEEPDFIYVQEFDLYGIIHIVLDGPKKDKNKKPNPIVWFNSQGENVVVSNPDDFADDCFGIDYCSENKQIILTGYGCDFGIYNGVLIVFNLHLLSDENHSYSLVLDSAYQKEEFGWDCMDITINKNAAMLISTGQFEECWNYRVFRVTNNSIDQYGTTPNKIGQINESMSFCIDRNGTLYTHNNSQTFINLFDTNGEPKPPIDLYYDFNSTLLGFPNSTFLSDIAIHDDKLAFAGVDPNCITEYSLQDEEWKLLYAGFSWFPSFWSGAQYYDHQYNLLFPPATLEETPSLFTIEDESQVNLIEGFSKAQNFKEPPIFIDFKITDVQYENNIYPEYQFLDCFHQTILIYDSTKRLQQIVQLPKDENSFYSSFDLYPDGSWIVTDFTQHRLLHIAKNGELIETMGSKGQVEIGTTKEAYLEKPDQFYFPIRAKIANNHIYVSDFGNCRYHKIPIEPVTINWNNDSIGLANISIFSSKSGSFHYDISNPYSISYEVKSTIPWLEIKDSIGSLSDKQIDYKIIGEKLTPWKIQDGEILITFSEKLSFLNHSIPVFVSAIGSTVELTIGSAKAKVDGESVALETGYIPVIKDGRTCIGLRFITEYLFRSHAAIEYEADVQRIKIITNDHIVYMIINQDVATVDGESVILDVPPFIQQGRTMVPLRFISESLEAEIAWEASTQKITINYPRRKGETK